MCMEMRQEPGPSGSCDIKLTVTISLHDDIYKNYAYIVCMHMLYLHTGGGGLTVKKSKSPCTEFVLFDLFKKRSEIPVRINYLSGEIEVKSAAWPGPLQSLV